METTAGGRKCIGPQPVAFQAFDGDRELVGSINVRLKFLKVPDRDRIVFRVRVTHPGFTWY